MTAQDIYNIAMDLIDERLETGVVDPNNTMVYEKRSPGLLTAWQNEMSMLLNVSTPQPITNLSDTITVDDNVTGAYFLAAKLVLNEDSNIAAYFEDKFEELKRIRVKKQPASFTPITDVYLVRESTE